MAKSAEEFLQSSKDHGSYFTIGVRRSDGDLDVFATLNRETFKEIPLEQFNTLIHTIAAMIAEDCGEDVEILERQDAPDVVEG